MDKARQARRARPGADRLRERDPGDGRGVRCARGHARPARLRMPPLHRRRGAADGPVENCLAVRRGPDGLAPLRLCRPSRRRAAGRGLGERRLRARDSRRPALRARRGRHEGCDRGDGRGRGRYPARGRHDQLHHHRRRGRPRDPRHARADRPDPRARRNARPVPRRRADQRQPARRHDEDRPARLDQHLARGRRRAGPRRLSAPGRQSDPAGWWRCSPNSTRSCSTRGPTGSSPRTSRSPTSKSAIRRTTSFRRPAKARISIRFNDLHTGQELADMRDGHCRAARRVCQAG